MDPVTLVVLVVLLVLLDPLDQVDRGNLPALHLLVYQLVLVVLLIRWDL